MTTREVPMPPGLVANARSWLDTPPANRPNPVPPRLAATVMVLREGSAGPEVFVQYRKPSMAFAPSMVVFPGGGVDRTDTEVDLPWHGPQPSEWAQWMPGTDSVVARSLVVAAAREVFEETGVLLAAEPSGAPLNYQQITDESVRRARAAVSGRELSFASFLAERGWSLRSDLLSARHHWITPECEPRRYDTWFFAARLPPGQHADAETSEVDDARWERPADLLARKRELPHLMLPPTMVALESVAAAAQVSTVLNHAVSIPAVMPTPAVVAASVNAPDGLVMRWSSPSDSEPGG